MARSDLTSLRAILKAELHRNSEFVDVAIADAIRFVRLEKFWFNGERYSFLTEPDRMDYELPGDFLGLRGRVYCTPQNSSSTSRYPVPVVSADYVETNLYSGTDYGAYQNTGIAKEVAFDLLEKKILVIPMPSTGGDKIEFKYTKDLGTPIYTVSTTASAPPSLPTTVTLLGPDGQTLPSTFTNEWFGEGFKLVKERALYELFSRFYGGSEEAGVSANGALGRFLEELNRLRGESNQVSAPNEVRKYL